MKIALLTTLYGCFLMCLECAVTCPNCAFGCGTSESCMNNTCKEGFYASGCKKVLPIVSGFGLINTVPSPCSVILGFDVYSNTSVLMPQKYYFAYSKGEVINPKTPSDFTTNNQTLTCTKTSCKTGQLSLEKAIYTFGAYFTFNDVDVYEALLSKIATVKGSCTTIVSTTTITTTTKATATKTTTKATATKTTTKTPGVVTTSKTTVTTKKTVDTTKPSVITPSTKAPVVATTTKTTTTTTTTTTTKNPVVTQKPEPPATGTVVINNPSVPQKSSDKAQVTFPNFVIQGNNIVLDLFYVAHVRVGNTDAASSAAAASPAASQNASLTRTKRAATDPTCTPSNIPGIPSNAIYVFADKSKPTSTLDIGSGESLSSYNCPNPALTSDSNYTVYSIVGSSNSFTTPRYWSSHTNFTTPSAGLSPGIIALIVILLLLLLLAILLLLLWFCWFKKRRSSAYKKPLPSGIHGLYSNSHDKPHSYCHWTSITDRMYPRKIMQNTNKLTGVTYKEEFEQLPYGANSKDVFAEVIVPSNSYEYSTSMTMYKNRILLNINDPLSPTKSQNTQDNNHYYNASRIDGYNDIHDYIAADSPHKDIIGDFWWLVYQENVGQIISVTGPFDIDRRNVFWPTSTVLETFELSISLCAEIHFKDFIIRDITIRLRQSPDKSVINVKQYQYTGNLTNDGIPVNIHGFLEFYMAVEMGKEKLHGPQLVHEYGGTSLTVVFIAFSILIQQLKCEEKVGVYKTLSHIKRARQLDPFNFNQYLLLYDLLFESRLAMPYNCENDDIENLKEYNFSSVFDFLRAYNIDYTSPVSSSTGFTMTNTRNVPTSLKLDSIYLPASIQLIKPSASSNHSNVWLHVFQENIDILVFLEAVDLKSVMQNTADFKIKIIEDQNDDESDSTEASDDVNDEYRGDTKKAGNRKRPLKLMVNVISSNNNKRSVMLLYLENYDLKQTDRNWTYLIEKLLHRRYKRHGVGLYGALANSLPFTTCLNIAATYKELRIVNFYLTIRYLANQNSQLITDREYFIRIENALTNWVDEFGHYSKHDNNSKNKVDHQTKDFLMNSIKMIDKHYYPVEHAHVSNA